MIGWARELARRGLVTLALTQRGLDRRAPPDTNDQANDLLVRGRTLMGAIVHEIRQAVTYLEGRDDVRADRIAVAAMSFGGSFTSRRANMNSRSRRSKRWLSFSRRRSRSGTGVDTRDPAPDTDRPVCAARAVGVPRRNGATIREGSGSAAAERAPHHHRRSRLRGSPNLDRLARDGARVDRFYVAPVCSPTRASLLTGRYHYRTGVVDTYLGRSLMHADEVTVAEMLSAAGYRTGIFGKWHLGDNYPLRAMDQGFHETLTLNGGGIGQPSDPPGGESYFDPMLRQNGRWVKTAGYVSDVITDAAIEFIDRHRARPFFAYLSFKAPHTPLQAPPRLYDKYRAMDLALDPPRQPGHPVQKFDADTTAKIYAMVENIDENVGRVLTKLDELKLAENTLVIFLTDNGPQQPRYNAGMLRLKGTVHEGGIRVPFFVRWPGRAPAGRLVNNRIAAHIDVTPTILEACGVTRPVRVRFDGVSLVPLLGDASTGWPARTLFFQWHRGDVPEEGRAFAVRSERYWPAGLRRRDRLAARHVALTILDRCRARYGPAPDPRATRLRTGGRPAIDS